MIHKEFNSWLIEFDGLAESSAYRYTLKIDRLGTHKGDLRKLDPLEVYECVSDLSGSKSDYNVWVSALRKYDEYLKFTEDGDYNLSSKLACKAPDKTLPKPLSQEEIKSILAQPNISTKDGLRNRLVLELLYCGLRNSECCSILLENIDDRTIKIKGKGSKERMVPINKKAWNLLVDYVVQVYGSDEHKRLVEQLGKDAIFKGIKNGFKKDTKLLFEDIYPRKVRRIVDRYAEEVGIENVHPHRFRHSFATHSLDEGLGNLIALKDVLGHENLNMVMKYTKTTKSGRDLVRSFHPNEK